jgi:CheY-like chemotaxis protein
VTTTLLAVDDSKTMRKVLEITFAGEDYKTVLAESAADAMAKLRSENPAVALVDASLGGESGYDLCLQIKQAAPQTVVLVMSSKQVPFDRAKGATAGADDHMDKPFDTQQLIDKVGAALRKGPTAAPGASAAAPATPPQAAPAGVHAPPQVRPPQAAPAARPGPQPVPGTRPQPTVSRGPMPGPRPGPGPAQRPGSSPQAAGRPPQHPARPAPTQQSRPHAAPQPQPRPAPAAQPAPVRRPTPPPMAAPVVAAATADMAGKLQGLGLTKDQVDGVMALSREVVEQVVWEVVPVLAETIIKEEIRRLTAD